MDEQSPRYRIPSAPLRLVAAIALFAGIAAVGPVLANGFGGEDSPPARIPTPARDFRAIVEDQSGVRVDVTQVTFNGEIFVYGTYGEGMVTVPFETIEWMRIEPSNVEEQRIAHVKLKDGNSVQVSIEADTPVYGRAAFGTYRITADKLRKVEFPG